MLFLTVTGNPSSFGNTPNIDSFLKAALAATKNPENNAHGRNDEDASQQIEINSDTAALNSFGFERDNLMTLQAQPMTPEQRKRPASLMSGNSNSNCGLPLIIQPKKSRTSSTTQTSPISFGLNDDDEDGTDGAPPNPAILLSDEKMFTVPAIDELNQHVQSTGNYVFCNLEVGHRDHGSVMFLGFRDLKALAGGRTINLSEHVGFRHGGIEFNSQTGALHLGPKLFSLFNVSRVEFGKQFGIVGEGKPTDQELKDILTKLTHRMNAAFSQYNEEQAIWLFMTFPPHSNGDGNNNGSS